MQEAREDLSNLFHQLRWCLEDGRIVHTILRDCDDTILVLVHWEQQIKDDPATAAHLRDNGNQGDL